MFNFYNFYRFFRKHRFVHAMASLPPGSSFVPAWQHYALYRLGMYRSVAYCEPVRHSWRSLFAVIVSLAACGERDRAEHLLSNESVSRVLRPHRLALAEALLAFHPGLAARLLPSNASPALQVAVCLFAGEISRGRAFLDKESAAFEQEPDFYLLRNNAGAYSPLEQMQGINKYLRAHSLAPIVLTNIESPPGAMSIQVDCALPIERGPLVSILMTAFNAKERIGFAIESLLAQSYQNLEIIVVDDASQDEVAGVVSGIATRDQRVRYLRLPVNVGTYVAKNIGLQLSRGDFVTCHDSDDWAHPEKIALQMEPLINDAALIFTTSHMVRIRDDGYFYARQIYPLTRLNSSSVLFRKQAVLERCGCWDMVRTGADSEFLARLKLVFGTQAMGRVRKPLSFCAHRPDSLMTQAGTGYDANRISTTRLEYWESFSDWHIAELRQGRLPKMTVDRVDQRPFAAPDSIRVPAADIVRCMLAFGLSRL